MHAGADERLELRRAGVALTASPDRRHVRGDRRQLGEVTRQIAIVVGGIEQASVIRSAIGVGEDGEAREMDSLAAGELDSWAIDLFNEALPADVISDRAKQGAQGVLLATANRREHGERSRHCRA